MNETGKKTIIIAIIALIVAALIALALRVKKPPSSTKSPSAAGGASQPSLTWVPPPANVTVPEKDSAVALNVAKPENVGPAAPGHDEDTRTFHISAEGNKFIPDTIIVRLGDVVIINVTAVDHDYDFFQPDYGTKAGILKGQMKPIMFGATAAGKFTFYCERCGGPEKGPVGYIIVTSK